MPRPARAFTAGPFALEGRLLLAARFHPTSTIPAPLPPSVQFESATSTTFAVADVPIQVVTQQAGEASVMLSRTDTAGSLQVEVSKDSFSPNVVGVNVGAGDQTATFADGQSRATLTVPILAGAPNPGVVDVRLSIKSNPPPTGSINPRTWLDLKIVASDPTLPPRVVFVERATRGILLGFNKPMDPVGASNVRNYVVSQVSSEEKTNLPGLIGAFAGGTHTTVYVRPVRLRSAQYDPATQSVTLIPKRPIPDLGGIFTSLTQARTARTSVRRGHRSNLAGSLTDLQGNPIDAGPTPGKVGLRVVYTSPSFTGSSARPIPAPTARATPPIPNPSDPFYRRKIRPSDLLNTSPDQGKRTANPVSL